MKRTVVAALAAVVSVAWPAAADADAVMDWNVHATTAILSAPQSPQVSALTYAIVQGAVYDAVNAVDGGHRPYLGAPAANPWDSQDAAAATAAFHVLVALFP